jgi:hypothetical protein
MILGQNQLVLLARDAFEASLDAHQYPVPSQEAWCFATSQLLVEDEGLTDREWETLQQTPMPNAFHTAYQQRIQEFLNSLHKGLRRELHGESDLHDPVADLEGGQLGEAGCDEAGLFAQFSGGHLTRIGVWKLPASLGQFFEARTDGVAELFDQPDEVAFGGVLDGDDDAGGVFVDDAVDTALAVWALDDVFADARPGIGVDLAGGDGSDRRFEWRFERQGREFLHK